MFCFVYSYFVLYFNRVSICAIVILACVSLTTVIFVVFTSTLIIFHACAYIFIGNVHTVEMHIIWVHMFLSISEVLNILCVFLTSRDKS